MDPRVKPAGDASGKSRDLAASTLALLASMWSYNVAPLRLPPRRPVRFHQRSPAIPFPGRATRLIAIGILPPASFAPVAAFPKAAAHWPDRPVRLLVPVGAGGAAD